LREEEATLFRRFDEETANIESAQNWWREHDPGKLLHLCAALGWYWMLRSNANNGLKWLEAALTANPDQQHTEIYAWALHGVGLLQGLRGDYRLSSATLKHCITVCQQSGARWMECHANVNLAYALCELGDYDGCSYHLGNARVLYDLEGEPNGQAAAWTVQGLMETRQGKYAEAAASNARSAAIYRAGKYPYGVAMAFQEMADALYHLGEYTQAVQILEECLTIKRSMRNTRSMALSLVDLSLCLLHTGEQERAKEMLIEGLLAFRQVGDRWGIARGLDVWAEMASQSGQPLRAAEAIGASMALRETLGTPLTADRAIPQTTLINQLRNKLGDKAVECALQIGRTLSLDYFIEHHQLHFP
jgi:tetratricopeptide (TPR) repeat protein